MRSTKSKIAGITVAAAALVGGGAAIAADQLTPKQESDTIVADAAKQLGVQASELDAALKKALSNRVDAAVAAGEITEAQGTAMKERIAAGEVPLVGVGPRGAHHGGGRHFASLDAAATYLGVTEAALRTSLEEGSTLAEIADGEGQVRRRAEERPDCGGEGRHRRGRGGRPPDRGAAGGDPRRPARPDRRPRQRRAPHARRPRPTAASAARPPPPADDA